MEASGARKRHANTPTTRSLLTSGPIPAFLGPDEQSEATAEREGTLGKGAPALGRNGFDVKGVEVDRGSCARRSSLPAKRAELPDASWDSSAPHLSVPLVDRD